MLSFALLPLLGALTAVSAQTVTISTCSATRVGLVVLPLMAQDHQHPQPARGSPAVVYHADVRRGRVLTLTPAKA